jgi:hypothetical protein
LGTTFDIGDAFTKVVKIARFVHLKEVMLFRLRPDKGVDIGRALRGCNQSHIVMPTEPDKVREVRRHPRGATKEGKLVYSNNGMTKDLFSVRLLDVQITQGLELFHTVELHPYPVIGLLQGELAGVL